MLRALLDPRVKSSIAPEQDILHRVSQMTLTSQCHLNTFPIDTNWTFFTCVATVREREDICMFFIHSKALASSSSGAVSTCAS
jgi:hypothetical protein